MATSSVVKADTDSIKCCTSMEVEGTTPRRRPRKTWWDGVKKDMKRFGLCQEDVHSPRKLRRKIKGA